LGVSDRSSFGDAAAPDQARPLVQAFGEVLLELGVKEVAFGAFGASMQVSLVNQGPATSLLDSKPQR
jgi:D-tyrosyl-tRNA(Tyr) deacylase